MHMTTILVRDETRERLKEIGKKGQSYDELINKLLENKNPNSVNGRTQVSNHPGHADEGSVNSSI
jgi:predicted CopG family antitoxin